MTIIIAFDGKYFRIHYGYWLYLKFKTTTDQMILKTNLGLPKSLWMSFKLNLVLKRKRSINPED